MPILSWWERWGLVALIAIATGPGNPYGLLGRLTGAFLFYGLWRLLAYRGLPYLLRAAPISAPRIPTPNWVALGRRFEKLR
jgi:hypothetical protein